MRRGPPRWRRPQAPQWVIAEKQSALRVLRLASNSHVRAIPRPWPSAFSRSRLTAAGRAARLKLAGLAVAPLSQGTGRVRTHPELGDDTGRDNTDKRHIRIAQYTGTLVDEYPQERGAHLLDDKGIVQPHESAPERGALLQSVAGTAWVDTQRPMLSPSRPTFRVAGTGGGVFRSRASKRSSRPAGQP
uniref:Uncharacterized protein n=1 Tax=Mycena chlorophos TaxID=658473 RepID=A0ABQ0LAT1_MYCCL|nr:predicted protein [Mycena chlorophos]